MCDAEHYDAIDGVDGVVCPLCPSGTNCLFPPPGGYRLSTLPVRPGYYRVTETSIDVRRCPDADSGCGGARQCPQTTSGCRGTAPDAATIYGRRMQYAGTSSTPKCHAGLTGVFCQACIASPIKLYYVPAKKDAYATCKPCSESGSDTWVVPVVFSLLLSVVLFVSWRVRKVPAKYTVTLRRVWAEFTPGTRLKIVISSVQIMTKVGAVYQVDLPQAVSSLMSALSVFISFGLSDVGVPLDCMGWGGYEALLIFWMVAPIVMASTILIAMALYTGRTRGQDDRPTLRSERSSSGSLFGSMMDAKGMKGLADGTRRLTRHMTVNGIQGLQRMGSSLDFEHWRTAAKSKTTFKQALIAWGQRATPWLLWLLFLM